MPHSCWHIAVHFVSCSAYDAISVIVTSLHGTLLACSLPYKPHYLLGRWWPFLNDLIAQIDSKPLLTSGGEDAPVLT